MRLGWVPFILAAVIESATYGYVIVSWMSVAFQCATYYLPIGTVLAAIVGVGSLVLTRSLSPEQPQHSDTKEQTLFA
jgi:hypothetical protein